MMVHAGSVHIHLRQPIQCAPESAMGCQSAQTGPGHARGRSLEENYKKCHREVYIYSRNFTNSWAHHWSGMKNPAVVALCQNEISWLASDLSASFLPQHFPRHSPKLPGFYLGYPPSSLKHKESIDTAGLEVDRDEPVNSDMVWVWLGVTNWTSHYHSESLKVSLIMFYLNIVDFPFLCIWAMYSQSDPLKVIG